MLEILDYIGAFLWAGAGVYVWITLRRFNKRCDRLLRELETEVELDRRVVDLTPPHHTPPRYR